MKRQRSGGEGILYENKSHKKIQEFKGQEIRCEYLWKYRYQGHFHAQPLWWNFTTWKLEQDWSALNTKWYFQRFLCHEQKHFLIYFKCVSCVNNITNNWFTMHYWAIINQHTSLTQLEKGLQHMCVYLEPYLPEFAANFYQAVGGPPSIYGVSHFVTYWVIYQWKKRLKRRKLRKEEYWKKSSHLWESHMIAIMIMIIIIPRRPNLKSLHCWQRVIFGRL